MDKRILELRQKIDTLDEEIIQLLKKRMGISKEVGKLKEKLDIPVEDMGREQEIIDAVKAEISLGEISDILREVFGEFS